MGGRESNTTIISNEMVHTTNTCRQQPACCSSVNSVELAVTVAYCCIGEMRNSAHTYGSQCFKYSFERRRILLTCRIGEVRRCCPPETVLLQLAVPAVLLLASRGNCLTSTRRLPTESEQNERHVSDTNETLCPSVSGRQTGQAVSR
jgi:hypothetical protein